ncbi:UNVERIFIED_CONTAM: Trihelix transcription factor GT-3b [Sesamum angustifolium]|uniref:Trihelix transcription factor GT-3b n=1 Tax=Sesamum angustifolium TaxID=2727405 RepID=A0AAW2M9J9_9LAMI
MMYNDAGNVSSSSTATPRNPTIPYPLLGHQVHQPIMIPLPPSPFSGVGGGGSGAGGGGVGVDDDDDFPRRDERFPQWSTQETRDLIEIRAQLEWDFTAARRTKNLWEMVACRMREKGYRRTSDQCKCKWKNLVNKYKGQEVSDVNNSRQCPFFNELHAVFAARANNTQQAQLDARTGTTKGRKRLEKASEDRSHQEFSEELEDEEEIGVDQAGKGRVIQKRKAGQEKRQKLGENENYLVPPLPNVNKNNSVLNSLQEMMRNFIMQQQRIDMQWKESMEKRAVERELFEQEWRQKMEKLERERLMMEQAWREREEQRRLREESRAQKRDALLTMLLNKLIRNESP